LIAIVASGGDDNSKRGKKPTAGSGSSMIEMPDEKAWADGASTAIERGKALIATEEYSAAVEVLQSARKANPKNAELAFLAGKAYFGQLWWTDGIKSFRDAIELDPQYKEDPDLLKTVLKGFLTTRDVDDRITEFMRHDIGPPMRPYLEETAEKHPKKNLRARAAAELNAGPD
jgi:tetratricopeptide (TPR) repeat protein